MVNPVRGHVTYVFDAYCGWCHGFTPWLREALADRPEVTVEVVSGGLFTGARRVPIRELTHIPTAWHRVTQVTGAAFGPSFLKLLEQGDFVMDSQDAATGLAGLRALAPARALDFAAEMSHAFYMEGLSLSDPATYATLATRHGLDAATAAAALSDPDHRRRAHAEFTRARELGADAFPTIFTDNGTGPQRLHGLGASPKDLGRHTDTALAPAGA
ncbi:DsbA family protein [Streptomyces olivoreticuli]|uniref:DsbA family protein n=1 Tax=Streptomyces olivoreticuli TaxID=68246 RepID=UPI000E25600D|nr:DsbA family protein [Streptomyces olivoreticuli]